jgi:hypothetical protein
MSSRSERQSVMDKRLLLINEMSSTPRTLTLLDLVDLGLTPQALRCRALSRAKNRRALSRAEKS